MKKRIMLVVSATLWVFIAAQAQENNWPGEDSIYQQIVMNDSVRLFKPMAYYHHPDEFLKKFHINDYAVKATQAIYTLDSLRFIYRLNELLSAQNLDEVIDASGSLDRLEYLKLIKKHSSEIIEKLSGFDKRYDKISNLLSLTDLPDSIRIEILEKGRSNLCKARLGDSAAIVYYMNDYVKERDRVDSEWRGGGLYYLQILLSTNSKTALDTIFSDIQSSRIITACGEVALRGDGCLRWYDYTNIRPILEVLMQKHSNEPLLNRRFLHPLIRTTYPNGFIPPQMPDFFKALEDFILKEYGYTVKINVPFVYKLNDEKNR